MYEFLGAVAARTALIEGEPNQAATLGACIGLIVMQVVAAYTGEQKEIYFMVLLKFTAAWLISGFALGLIVAIIALFRFRPDQNPKTRAWPRGPKLPAVFLAAREVVSAVGCMFIPLTDSTDRLIKNGMGYERFYVLIGSLWAVLAIGYFITGNIAVKPQKPKTN